ncbi:imm11 family protein [Rheinheimera sp. EpRS3]|uniref:imm11 family protein n=1 Tax=Rheinheimera sp. EpRS3 TaxID=1712383 RepID=UPI0007491368|nr:DUF1629 domain-containing protein [Rheinheimera sp. EpRS3]KUM54808.1 hypothetical protein AR688_16215 [Rheinheimera sp. EpRS3]
MPDKELCCFAIIPDVENYAMLQETPLELVLGQLEPMDLHGKPIADKWQSIKVSWLTVPGERPLLTPDIAAFNATAFAAKTTVCEQLGLHQQESCELLPISVDGEAWSIIHVLTELDAVDEQQSERKIRRGGQFGRGFSKLVLKLNAVSDTPLFRVKGAGLRIFTSSAADSFYQAVQTADLKGLIFKPVATA